MNERKSPCSECVFRKDSVPGECGGSHPMVYVGQVTAGVFSIPCHKPDDYDPEAVRGIVSPSMCLQPSCAGAAIMAANLGINRHPSLLKLEPDDSVFSGWYDFLKHHTDYSEAELRFFSDQKAVELSAKNEILKVMEHAHKVR